MPDLFIRERPRQRTETTTRWKIVVPTDDPIGVLKLMRRNWRDAARACLMRERWSFPVWSFDEAGEPQGFYVGVGRNKLLLMVETHSSSEPTVELRHSIFSAWHAESYVHHDDSAKILRSFAYLVEVGGVESRLCPPPEILSYA